MASNVDFDFALMAFDQGVRLLLIHDGKVQRNMAVGLGRCERLAWADQGVVALLTHRAGKSARWRNVLIAKCGGHGFYPFVQIGTPIPVTDLAWFDGGNLVVCGESKTGSRAFVVDPFPVGSSPADHVHRWQALAMPPELERWRKGYDALVVHGKELIAIDNFVLPKWLVKYEAAGGEAPRPTMVANMVSNGACECARTAANGRTCFAVLSTTLDGCNGPRAFITLYRHGDLAPVCGLQLPSNRANYAMLGNDLLVLQPEVPGIVRRYRADIGAGGDTGLKKLVDYRGKYGDFPQEIELLEPALIQTLRFSEPFTRLCCSSNGSVVLATDSPNGPVEVV